MGAAKQPPAASKTGGGDGGSSDPADALAPAMSGGAGDDPVLKRRKDLFSGGLVKSRLPRGYEWSLSPGSMVGSWFHRLENDRMIWRGVVVAEPQPGRYLVEVDKLDLGAENVQVLVKLDAMMSDEDGYGWHFYDSEDDAKVAYAAWMATERERTAR